MARRTRPRARGVTILCGTTRRASRNKPTRAIREGRRRSAEYKVIETFAGASLLEVSLHTGRRNQIRIQARLHGHTLVGEDRYTYGPESLRPIDFGRHALHARQLTVRHPTDGRSLRIRSAATRGLRRVADSVAPRSLIYARRMEGLMERVLGRFGAQLYALMRIVVESAVCVPRRAEAVWRSRWATDAVLASKFGLAGHHRVFRRPHDCARILDRARPRSSASGEMAYAVLHHSHASPRYSPFRMAANWRSSIASSSSTSRLAAWASGESTSGRNHCDC